MIIDSVNLQVSAKKDILCVTELGTCCYNNDQNKKAMRIPKCGVIFVA